MKTKYIVAEVSKNWPEIEPGLLCQRFEKIIETNLARGWRILSFQLHRLMVEPGKMNETIIAVFEKI